MVEKPLHQASIRISAKSMHPPRHLATSKNGRSRQPEALERGVERRYLLPSAYRHVDVPFENLVLLLSALSFEISVAECRISSLRPPAPHLTGLSAGPRMNQPTKGSPVSLVSGAISAYPLVALAIGALREHPL